MNRSLGVIAFGVCLTLCVVLTACANNYAAQADLSRQTPDTADIDQDSKGATAVAPTTIPALTLDALRNAEYAAGLPSYGTLQRDRIGAQDPLAFGDLDGDGVDDAAVVLLLVDGNAGHFYLAAVLSENGAPRHVASAFLGLNIGIDLVAIADGIVTLQTKQLGPNDPNCCPTKEVVVTLQLTDSAWQLLAETPPGQVTANFHVHADADTIAAALEALRSTEVGETVAAWFLDSGGSVTFDDAPSQNLPDIPEIPFAVALDLQENAIYMETAHRGESAETLAAWLAGSMTQSISLTLEGEPRSTAACFDLIQLAYHARAAVWYEFYGDEGKPNPNSQEAFLNRNLQRAMSGILGEWVRDVPFYRQFCAQFGVPPRPTPVPTPVPPSPTPVPTPTPIPLAPVGAKPCLTSAELDYLVAFQTTFWEESTQESSNAWFTAANAASAAYYGLNDVPTGNTELRLVRLANQAIEALRTYGLSVHEALLELAPAPSARTEELLNRAVQHYQTIEFEYVGILEHYGRPLWMQARILPQQLVSISHKTFEELLDVATQYDALAAKPRCQ